MSKRAKRVWGVIAGLSCVWGIGGLMAAAACADTRAEHLAPFFGFGGLALVGVGASILITALILDELS